MIALLDDPIFERLYPRMTTSKLPRYLQRAVDGYKWPMLLICEGKHDTKYYVLKDKDALWRASVDVLKERIAIGYIHKPAKEPYGLYDALTDEQIATLPPRLKETELFRKKANDRLWKEHAEELDDWARAVKAADEGDGETAFVLLSDRADYEYEGFKLVGPVIP